MRYLFSLVFPWLLVLWLVQALALLLRSRLNSGIKKTQCQGWRALLGFGLASAAIVFLPVGGIPLGRWVAGLSLPPSLPLLGLLAGQVWRNLFDDELFGPEDRHAAWVFGALAGTFLYPLAMGLGSFDPYALGWNWTVLFPVTALLTIYLIRRQNHFAFLLLASIIAYDLHWLESPNFWDYLVDPVYWLISVCLLAKGVWERIRGKKPVAPAER